MRRYGQFCGLARALDVVGDRWALLIVRELLIRPARYGELRDGLPGIATNLLAQRLRELEDDGIVEKRTPAGSGSPVYRLTARGRALEPVLVGLAAWAAPFMASGPGSDEHRGRWLVVAARAILGEASGLPDCTVRFVTDGEAVTVRVAGGEVVSELGDEGHADVEVVTDYADALALLSGRADVTVVRRGRHVTGSPAAIRTLRRLGRHVARSRVAVTT